ncbi:MAG: YccF domain-containing protein [Candidatus Cloacimonetes bacterium]|nr:YccF domain-containing protein [Candidatus Cloacimonadota bacterium]
MSLLGNILWIIFGGGFLIALQYLLGGLILCITIIGIPFGLQCIKLAEFSLFPFGREVLSTGSENSTPSVFLNIIWLICGGIWIAVSHLILAAGLAVTIIGIPFAIQHIKMASLSVMPFGKTFS